MRYALLTFGDTHCGSTIGLHPPGKTPLEDGGFWKQTDKQGWLWRCFSGDIAWTKSQIKKFGADHTTILANGDLVDGPDHHKTYQTISRHPGAEKVVCMQVLEYALDATRPDAAIIMRGTESHVGPGGAAEEGVASQLKRDGWPIVPTEHDNVSHWYFEGSYPGKYPVPWNATHHGRIGQRPWTKPNVALNLAVEIEIDHGRDGLPVPRVCYRSHLHQKVDTGPAQPVRLIALPCYQISTAHVHQKHAGKLADIGLALTLVDTDAPEEDEQLRVRFRIHRPKRTRKVWSPAA